MNINVEDIGSMFKYKHEHKRRGLLEEIRLQSYAGADLGWLRPRA